MSALAKSTLLYVFGYIPLVAVIGVCEGAVRYQEVRIRELPEGVLAFVLFHGPWLLMSGILAVPFLVLLYGACLPIGRLRRVAWLLVTGVSSVMGSGALVFYLLGYPWLVPCAFLLYVFPFAFVVGTLLYSMGIASVIERMGPMAA